MTSALSEHFANPSSAHRWGGRARDLVEEARIELATLLNASPRELFWTSGATEANNLALFGVAESADEPIHIISQVTEHSAVLKPLKVLEGRGHQVTLLDVDERGLVSVDALRAPDILKRLVALDVSELMHHVAPLGGTMKRRSTCPGATIENPI